MGQKVNPIGLRLGYIRGWESSWFATKKTFGHLLLEDKKIRDYIYARFQKAEISKIVIERTLKKTIITLHTARPGMVIGKGGAEIEKLREELKRLTNKDVQVNVFEIRRAELDAKLVGYSIGKQITARISHRKVIKQALVLALRNGAKGIKVKISGRIGGAEMARKEVYKEGRVPLHTLRADIDYHATDVDTSYGKIGIKVWIFKKELYKVNNLSLNNVQKSKNNF